MVKVIFIIIVVFGYPLATHENKISCKSTIYRILLVPLKDEILNLWDDFRCIVEYLQCIEGVIKLINSI